MLKTQMSRYDAFTASLLLGVACLGGCSGDDGGATDATLSTSMTSTSTSMTATMSTSVATTTGTTGDESATGVSSTTSAETSTSSGETSTGPAPACGDGVVDDGEECDEGPSNSDEGECTSECKEAVCGDGHIGPAEFCDDGNTEDGDQCPSDCLLSPECGDGIIQRGDDCDDGNDDNTDACLNTCVSASCGDGHVYAGVEECDDGNADNSDGCTTLCAAPSCTDGLASGDESDVDCGGSCEPCGVGGVCVAGSDCESGFCDGGACTVAATCKAIKGADEQAADGLYTIDPDGDGGEEPFAAYCDMSTDGGGWTLVLNLDTSDGHVMWWANSKWTDGSAYGSAETALTEDHISVGWSSYAGATELLLAVHEEGSTVGWKSFSKSTNDTMRGHVMGGDNVLLGSAVKNSDIAGVWDGEGLVRLSTKLYANHCVATGGACTSGAGGSPDGDRIGSHEATPANNKGGGLGNWHDMNYCCNGDYGSGKTCNGSAFRTASEAQSGWAACYGGNGHFGTDTFAASTNTCSNAGCGDANWSQPNGQDYDYALFLR